MVKAQEARKQPGLAAMSQPAEDEDDNPDNKHTEQLSLF